MKTPKPSTPATKSKLNTPRSGFIQKNSDSSKKVKFSVLSNADKNLNGTPKLEHIPFKEKKFNNFSGKKSIVLNNADKNLNETPKLENTPFKEKKFNNFSGKKSISPFSAKVNANTLIANKQTNWSPIKRKADTESTTEILQSVEKPSKKASSKTGNQFHNSPSSKIKENKTSPEVQLGLDIEQYLDKKSSIKKNKNDLAHATPLGNKQQETKALKQAYLKFPKDNSGKAIVRAKNKKQLTNTGKASPKISLSKTVNESADIDGLVNSITLKNAVKALIKYVDDNPKEKNEIFGVHVPFFIQVNFVKVSTSKRTRILVPHSALPENSDICLFISDKKKKTRDPEDLIDETKNLLRKYGVSCITEIMPWRHALKEHTQYEQRKKLANRFDLFLIEGKLAKLKPNLFNFPLRKKPIPVILEPSSKVTSSIAKAIRKLSIVSRGVGLSKTINFGHYKMEPNHLTENIEAILKIVCNETYFPGGRNNIRSVVIKTGKSIAFPLYISTKSPNLVEAPVQTVVKEDEDAVEGELTTYPNYTVKVFKDGTVVTKPIKENVKKKKAKELKGTKKQEEDEELEDDADSESDEEDKDIEEDDSENEKELEKEEQEADDDDDEEEAEEDEEDPELELEVDQIDNNNKVKNLPKKNKTSYKKQYESSTDEDELEEAEQSFLQELRQMQDEIESKKPQKKSQIKQQTIDKKNPVKREASLKSEHDKKPQENLKTDKKAKKRKAKLNKVKVPSGDDHKKTLNTIVAVNTNISSPSASKKSKKKRPRKNKQNNLSSSQEKMRQGKKVPQ
uniref:Putative ribosomal l1 domain-containing protein 1 n=1 Tax=Panstrongylus lignarius TaxID=156445 RepID=A0A224XK58_9HEMI